MIKAATPKRRHQSGDRIYKTESELRDEIVLVDKSGNRYSPYQSDEIDEDALNFYAGISDKIILMHADMLTVSDPNNIHYFIFPGKGSLQQNICDPLTDCAISMEIGEISVSWKLPLPNLNKLLTESSLDNE